MELPTLSWCHAINFLLELPTRSWCYAVNFHGPSLPFQARHAILGAQPLSKKQHATIWKRFWDDSVASFRVAFRPIFSRWILCLKMFENGHDGFDRAHMRLVSRHSKMIWIPGSIHFIWHRPATANVRSCAFLYTHIYIYLFMHMLILLIFCTIYIDYIHIYIYILYSRRVSTTTRYDAYYKALSVDWWMRGWSWWAPISRRYSDTFR